MNSSFYIVEVDVYKTGFNLTKDALTRTKAAVANNASISDAIQANKVGGDFPECAIVLKFVRYYSNPSNNIFNIICLFIYLFIPFCHLDFFLFTYL